MDLKELMEKRTKAWDEAKAFAESKKDENGLMSDEDFKTYEEMERTIENYTREIERKKREEEMDGMATLFRTHSLRCLCKVVFLFLRAFRPVL